MVQHNVPSGSSFQQPSHLIHRLPGNPVKILLHRIHLHSCISHQRYTIKAAYRPENIHLLQRPHGADRHQIRSTDDDIRIRSILKRKLSGSFLTEIPAFDEKRQLFFPCQPLHSRKPLLCHVAIRLSGKIQDALSSVFQKGLSCDFILCLFMVYLNRSCGLILNRNIHNHNFKMFFLNQSAQHHIAHSHTINDNSFNALRAEIILNFLCIPVLNHGKENGNYIQFLFHRPVNGTGQILHIDLIHRLSLCIQLDQKGHSSRFLGRKRGSNGVGGEIQFPYRFIHFFTRFFTDIRIAVERLGHRGDRHSGSPGNILYGRHVYLHAEALRNIILLYWFMYAESGIRRFDHPICSFGANSEANSVLSDTFFPPASHIF